MFQGNFKLKDASLPLLSILLLSVSFSFAVMSLDNMQPQVVPSHSVLFPKLREISSLQSLSSEQIRILTEQLAFWIKRWTEVQYQKSKYINNRKVSSVPRGISVLVTVAEVNTC